MRTIDRHRYWPVRTHDDRRVERHVSEHADLHRVFPRRDRVVGECTTLIGEPLATDRLQPDGAERNRESRSVLFYRAGDCDRASSDRLIVLARRDLGAERTCGGRNEQHEQQ